MRLLLLLGPLKVDIETAAAPDVDPEPTPADPEIRTIEAETSFGFSE